MALSLRTITFNHDLTSATTSALNIRKNKDFETALPEYDSAITRNSREQCAAYSVATTRNQAVFVRCVFTLTTATVGIFEVRARLGGVLGPLDVRTVSFSGPSTVTVDFPLNHRSFIQVGRHDVTWIWQWRLSGTRKWISLANTSHRIYLLLSMPREPWTQTFGDRRNPWTDLLDHACAIAAGDASEMTASIALTKAINSQYSLRYDIIGGSPRYGYMGDSGQFSLTQWITNVLNGTPPPAPTFCPGTAEIYNDNWIVNCYDSAASLALMAKLIGVRLDYYYHEPFGYLRFVEPIGRGKCNNPFLRLSRV